MSTIQSQIRIDIDYLAASWKSPKLYSVNGDISKEKSFENKPALLSFLKPVESKPGTNSGKLQTWAVELFIVFAKLPDGCDITTRGREYDEQSGEMAEILDKIHTGLTKTYINSKKNPIAHSRGYTAVSTLSFLDTYFEFGANKYMAVRASFTMMAPVKECFDCKDYLTGTFESVNVPPYDVNTIGGNAGEDGDLLRWSSAVGKWTRLHPGDENQVLQIISGKPVWVDFVAGGKTKSISIEEADFTGDEYINALLVGLAPEVDFDLFTRGGSGTLLSCGTDDSDGYQFDDATGTITAPAQKYSLKIY